MNTKDKTIIGLTEKVLIKGPKGNKHVTARIDTGATKSSIDSKLAKRLGFGPVERTIRVKSADGSSIRPVVKIRIKIHKRVLNVRFTLADRTHMKYKVLIGQNILSRRFLIDPSK